MRDQVSLSLKDAYGTTLPTATDPQRVLHEELAKNLVCTLREAQSTIGHLKQEMPEMTLKCLRCDFAATIK